MKSAGILAAVFAVSSVSSCIWAETETAAETAAGFAVVNLKTDGITDPLGIDDTTPSFSWQMESSAVGAAQSSYQIVVTDPEEKTVWDSGIVESADSVDILYEGEELSPVLPTAGRLR